MTDYFKKEIENITRQIIEKYKPEKIILFGSAVQGTMTRDSDVDFLIIKKKTPLYGVDRMRELSRMIERDIPVRPPRVSARRIRETPRNG